MLYVPGLFTLQGHNMDWELAIERNRTALLGIVATLFSLLGLADGGTLSHLSRALHRAALRVLLPAESAVRRLIVIAAKDLVVTLRPARPLPPGRVIAKGEARPPAFPLLDPRRRFSARPRGAAPRAIPRIHVFTPDPRIAALWRQPAPQAAPPAGTRIDAARLGRRLQALKSALDDLPRQARRLARWRARQQRKPGPVRLSPLRRGPPPGHRRTSVYDVDAVLRECHGLAFDALRPDTS
jgi:hypothetical protein